MIPADLRALDQWVCWRYETRGGKPTKVPLDPNRGGRASTTDPSTWGSYRQALSVIDAEGIGFVFCETDPFCGIDLDDCMLRSGALHPDAWRVVRDLRGFTDFSPSGNGLHIIVRGRLPRGRRTSKTPWRGVLELYSAQRFFTMGEDGRGEPRDAQPELDALIAQYFTDTPVALVRPREPLCGDDVSVVDRVIGDARMAALWAGDCSEHAGDHSAADLALCCHLAYLTGNDAARMDSLFRRSGLFREKWNEPRGDSTYGRQTIERALRK